MDAFLAVDELSNVKIDGNAGEHVCIITAQMLSCDEKVDHLAGGQVRCSLEILVESLLSKLFHYPVQLLERGGYYNLW